MISKCNLKHFGHFFLLLSNKIFDWSQLLFTAISIKLS
jgi:hypothetical protein